MDKPYDEKKELIPDTCVCGRGRLRPGITEYVTKVEDSVLVIKKVPALICDLCGESYLTPEASREIDKMVKDFRDGKLLARPIAAGEVDLRVSQAA
jgi:YgiT-type zinc finger domain-containing protein